MLACANETSKEPVENVRRVHQDLDYCIHIGVCYEHRTFVNLDRSNSNIWRPTW